VAEHSVHKTADVAADARIGDGTQVWNQAQIREGVSVGSECIIGKNVYLDFGVVVGNRVKIQNNSSIYHGVTIEDGVFVGPHVCFCNDVLPRAITPSGALKGQDDWEVGPTLVRYGASIGAGSIVLPNVTIGTFALVGAGSVVTRDVPDYALVYGNPARQRGYVCACGRKVETSTTSLDGSPPRCLACEHAVALAARTTSDFE
jgi:acetyltransferase-like isoleucine patch superfamily enzyme